MKVEVLTGSSVPSVTAAFPPSAPTRGAPASSIRASDCARTGVDGGGLDPAGLRGRERESDEIDEVDGGVLPVEVTYQVDERVAAVVVARCGERYAPRSRRTARRSRSTMRRRRWW